MKDIQSVHMAVEGGETTAMKEIWIMAKDHLTTEQI
jgi:hypothetical protein